MATHGHGAIQKHGHGQASILSVLLRLFTGLKNLGLAGYALEALLKLSHASHRAHHKLHFLDTPRIHLLAVLMILTGHLAEHLHQEEENHHQEARLAGLESRLADLERAKKAAVSFGGRGVEASINATGAAGLPSIPFVVLVPLALGEVMLVRRAPTAVGEGGCSRIAAG
eukprot:CAMPEP_0176063624 /NCGR_PEP_ID=MMETSP0120_2-20121206/31733_1 /TAXON_ID=160619 /ORGANISM="Kryptoperidinium foliaceum, Strain CCMP 1326" /LENGTH=169 /DNA_ID=CAMNT_0017397199 /DNA_START=50 /DNA_END=554 /DNA_ORIENTATION=-